MVLSEGIKVEDWWCPEEYIDKGTKDTDKFDYAILKLAD